MHPGTVIFGSRLFSFNLSYRARPGPQILIGTGPGDFQHSATGGQRAHNGAPRNQVPDCCLWCGGCSGARCTGSTSLAMTLSHCCTAKEFWMAGVEKFFFNRWEAAPSLGVLRTYPGIYGGKPDWLKASHCPTVITPPRLNSPTSGPVASIIKMIAVQTKESSG